MPERRRKYDREFRAGAVRIVTETQNSIAQVARDLRVHEGTLGNWVAKDRAARGDSDTLTEPERDELKRLRKRCVELEMERDVSKRATFHAAHASQR